MSTRVPERSAAPPWLASLSARPAIRADGSLTVSGWLVGPGNPPAAFAAIGERRVDLDWEFAPDGVAGVPGRWPVWRWRLRMPDNAAARFSIRTNGGRDLRALAEQQRSGAGGHLGPWVRRQR